MQNVGYNKFKRIFPFLLISKFKFVCFNQQPKIINIKYSFNLCKDRTYPEVVFWLFFFLNAKKVDVSTFFKKRYMFGKSSLSKIFLSMNKNFGSQSQIFKSFSYVYKFMIPYTREISELKTYPLRSSFSLRTLSFNDVRFDNEHFMLLMNVAPYVWNDYSFKIHILPYHLNGFHFRFLLQAMSLPIS